MLTNLRIFRFASTENTPGEEEGVVFRFGPDKQDCIALFCLGLGPGADLKWIRVYHNKGEYASYLIGSLQEMVEALEEALYAVDEVYVTEKSFVSALDRWGFKEVSSKAKVL